MISLSLLRVGDNLGMDTLTTTEIEQGQKMKTVKTSDGKHSFNYAYLYEPAIIRACQEWYGNVDLEALFDTIDRWESGERPTTTKLLGVQQAA